MIQVDGSPLASSDGVGGVIMFLQCLLWSCKFSVSGEPAVVRRCSVSEHWVRGALNLCGCLCSHRCWIFVVVSILLSCSDRLSIGAGNRTDRRLSFHDHS